MKTTLIHLLLATFALQLPAPSQSVPIRLRVPVEPGEQALLLLSTHRGPALRLPDVGGVLRLDPVNLIVIPAGAPDRDGVCEVTLPIPAGYPEHMLHAQAVRFSVQGVRIDRRFEPLVDLREGALERAMPLGTNTGGDYLFDLGREQMVATVRHYLGPEADPGPLLRRMRRPLDAAACAGLDEDLGVAGACRVLHELWQRALAGEPLPVIQHAIGARIELLEDQEFARRHPNGVSDDDEHWDGMVPSSGPGVDTCSDYTYVENGSYRLTSKARILNLGILVEASGKTRAYSRPVGYPDWSRFDADEVEVRGECVKNPATSGTVTKVFWDWDYDDWKVREAVTFSDSPFLRQRYELSVDSRVIHGSWEMNISSCKSGDY